MSIEKPLISVLLPTRDGAKTLRSAIATALDQRSQNYEVIVSDNLSMENVKEVVDGFDDRRLKYVKTPRRMNMCDSFEFALEHALGQYITSIGNDDGMVPGGIDRLERIITQSPSPAYFWTAHEYTWPIDGNAGRVRFLSPKIQPHEMNISELAKDNLYWTGVRYGRMPHFYHNLWSAELFERIRKRTGRVFHSTQPDVYLSFVFPAICDRCLHVGEAMSINGQSVSSTPIRVADKDPENSMAKKMERFTKEFAGYKLHPTLLPDTYLVLNLVADAPLVAMDLFPEYYKGMKFNYNTMWAWMSAIWGGETPAETIAKRRKIRERHSFSVIKFLAYWTLMRSAFWRRQIRSAITRKQTSINAPTDLLDFAKQISRDPKYTTQLEAGPIPR